MTPDDVLAFWFPPGHERDEATHLAQVTRWFRGSDELDREIRERFGELVEAAAAGKLAAWAETPRGRLALIIVLDQFSRTVFRGTPRAYAQDAQALSLAREGLQAGWDREMPVWERLFLSLPLTHSEDVACCARAADYVAALAQVAPPELCRIYEFAASQAAAHRDVVARFGRHPQRNAVLGRASTPEELEYVAAGPVHLRPVTFRVT